MQFKIIPYIILGVLVIAGVAGASWYFVARQPVTPPTAPLVQPEVTPPEEVPLEEPPVDETADWYLFKFDGWAVKLPLTLLYCGDTDSIPFCIREEGTIKGAVALFNWDYGAGAGGLPGTCGVDLNECKEFLRKDFFQEGLQLRNRTVNGISGFELFSQKRRTFYAELSNKQGLLAMNQARRNVELDALYEKILSTLRVDETYRFDSRQLSNFPSVESIR